MAKKKSSAVIVPGKDKKTLHNKERKPIYTIITPYLQTPIPVYAGQSNAWWMDKEKLETLIGCFENNFLIKEACLTTGISAAQYDYFIKINPQFSGIKDSLKDIFSIIAKGTLKKGLNEDANLAFRYLQNVQPEHYRKGFDPSAGGATLSETSFFDEKGNLLMNHRRAEIHGDTEE